MHAPDANSFDVAVWKQGLAADSSGDVYLITGNGTTGTART